MTFLIDPTKWISVLADLARYRLAQIEPIVCLPVDMLPEHLEKSCTLRAKLVQV
jgi:hypothetical protein